MTVQVFSLFLKQKVEVLVITKMLWSREPVLGSQVQMNQSKGGLREIMRLKASASFVADQEGQELFPQLIVCVIGVYKPNNAADSQSSRREGTSTTIL